eukprot:Seg1466.2 transcript_id=Seg1466.2/GoldUCD/mRNA.D3Y31 product="hypothetical protein" protein_id=Seg1466.2/GoldUCD/D3Y31
MVGMAQKDSKQGNACPWEEFLKETLLRDGMIDGVLLLTSIGDHVYSYGELSFAAKEDYSQFIGVFDYDETREGQSLFQSGIKLTLKKENKTENLKFVVRKKTFHSFYATSNMNQLGLVVINLPFGILITSHRHPITSAVAADFVERAAELLRM